MRFDIHCDDTKFVLYNRDNIETITHLLSAFYFVSTTQSRVENWLELCNVLRDV